MLCHDCGNDISRFERHDGDGTDGDILGSGEEGVGQDADEARIKTVLGIQQSDFGV